MLTRVDVCDPTFYHVVHKAEVRRALKRGDQLARLRETARRPRPTPSVAPVRTAPTRVGWLARTVRSFRWLVRPARA